MKRRSAAARTEGIKNNSKKSKKKKKKVRSVVKSNFLFFSLVSHVTLCVYTHGIICGHMYVCVICHDTSTKVHMIINFFYLIITFESLNQAIN